jgi:regulating synaptic membrane exocytosis protein 2
MHAKYTTSMTTSKSPQPPPSSLQQQQQQQRQQKPNTVSSYTNSAINESSMMPDLSHLSEEERRIIEAVMQRQREEEARDTITQQTKRSSTQHDLSEASPTGHKSSISSTVANGTVGGLSKLEQRHSISDIAQEYKQRYGSVDAGLLCDICKKTKFASRDGGHQCFNCKLRCCVRCSFKYTFKNKVNFFLYI